MHPAPPARHVQRAMIMTFDYAASWIRVPASSGVIKLAFLGHPLMRLSGTFNLILKIVALRMRYVLHLHQANEPGMRKLARWTRVSKDCLSGLRRSACD